MAVAVTNLSESLDDARGVHQVAEAPSSTKSNTLLDGFTGLGHFIPGDHTTSLTMWLASHWTFLYSSGLLSVSGR